MEIVEKPAAPHIQLGGDRPVFLRPPGQRPGAHDPPLGARRAGDHRPQPALPGSRRRCTWSGCRAAAPGSMPARPTACCRPPPSCRPSSRAPACWSAARRRWRSAWASSTPTRCARTRARLGKTELGRVLMELAEGEHAVTVERLAIPDVLLITRRDFSTRAGSFPKPGTQRRFAEAGIPGPFVQDNHALSGRTRRAARTALPDRARTRRASWCAWCAARSGTWRWTCGTARRLTAGMSARC